MYVFVSSVLQNSNVSQYAAKFKNVKYMLVHGTGDGEYIVHVSIVLNEA